MWSPAKTKKYGVAVYNWKGDVRYGLPLEIGETVQILEENSGWYRGFSTKNRAIKGIFPSTYIHLKPCRIENEGLFESVIPIEDPVLREVTQVLREWGLIWKNLFVDREHYKFTTVRKVMRELLEWRRQLLTGTLTQDQTREIKLKITNKIDWGNRKLGLDLVPRMDSHMVDPAGMSAVELHQVHVQSSENSQQAVSSRGTLKQKPGRKVLTHHLYLCMRDFGHYIGEETEVYLSLYDNVTGRFLTDRYLIQISKQGFSNYIEKLHNNCTIFTDLGNADLKKEIYLVAHVMRIGKMVYNDSNRKSNDKTSLQCFKRPVGVAVLNISEALNSTLVPGEEKESTFKVVQGEEKDFFQLHEFIIKKQNNKFSSLQGQPNYGIVISFKLLHGELSQVREEYPILFKNISLTKKLGFPDIILPGDVRNDLYITLDKGEFERGGKSTSKNIEVTVLVLDGDGKVLENCLWGACGMDPQSDYHSMIIYHHNSPHWNETIRLTVPIDKFSNSHVRFEFRHCSTRDKADNKKLFGFSFARLMSNDATLKDSTHELYVYKCEDKNKLNPEQYLKLASNMQEANEMSASVPGYSRSHKEVFSITTLLCSTKLTQNVDLLALLKWKSHPERINETLNKVLKLGGEELVKFLQDVLDSLFAMFSTEDGNSTAHSGQVFHVLVSIFSLLDEGKFEHFKPVMDTYIKGHFAAALVYKGLLSSVQHCADYVQTSGNQEPLQKCFRSLEYIFKFIIQSRLLFARATEGQYEETFRKDLFLLFKALNAMLSKNNPVTLNTQVAMLHSISAVFEQLTQVLPTVEVTRLASSMLESLPTRDISPQLTQAKLAAIKNMVSSQLFYEDESRNLLLNTCCKHIKLHLAHRDELKLCTEILTEIINYLFKQRQLQDQGKVNNCIHLDIEILCLHILDILVQTLTIIIDRPGTVLGSLVACLMGLLQLMDEYHYKRLWEEYGERKSLKDLLAKIFYVFHNLVETDVFPTDWLIMKMVVNNIILNSLQELAQPLVFKFLNPRPQFDVQIWTAYFNLAVAYLTQTSLQLEKFSQVKREMIVEKYGDMRVLMGFQMLSMWSNLGENKIHFTQLMVGPFLEVTLVPETELRKATLHIFYDMIQVEQCYHGSFKNVENELIEKLDQLISENKGDDEYRQLFNTILLDKVQTEDPQWKDSGKAFITSVTRLLERLLDYRSVIHGDENRDKRMHCTVNLLNFYKNEINRKEMYLRYIHKLHDLHLSADNFLEAGFTMKLYADQLTWSTRVLQNDTQYPRQEEWKRKEQLYYKIITYFDRGKAWEKGIPLCKELAELYESKLFNYEKLSAILRNQAKFFDNILTQLRPEPEYFRVGFYGLSFPLFVRNKLFVYRGLEYERIGAFTQRLQTEFPSAQILTKNTPPDDSILHGDGQFIQISNVKPLNEGKVTFKGIETVPEKISSYYDYNDVRKFQLDRPVHKGPVDKDNEFKSLWIERTFLVISHPLPSILRWFEVIETSIELIPPVQFACETMDSMNKELKQLTALYSQTTKHPDKFETKLNINPFSMRLQGIIDANVMGGIVKYQQAFFTQEFTLNHSEYLPFVHRLKCLLNEQILLLENALILHGQLCTSEMQPLHKRLQERFLQLRDSLRDFGNKSIINTPLPPVPVENKKPGQHYEMYCNRYSNSITSENVYEDGIYSKPAECSGNSTPPVPHRKSSSSVSECNTQERPPKPTHQRSLSKPLSPRTARHVSVSDEQSSASLRNSWSEELRNDSEDAPPLPPRGLVPDKRSGFLVESYQTPSVPPKRPLSQKSSNSNSIFYTDAILDISIEDGTSTNSQETSTSETVLRNESDREDVLRDSGCYLQDSRQDLNSSMITPNFNNLSYEDFDLKSRLNVQNNFNIQFNGDIPPEATSSLSGEEKQLNTCETTSPPVLSPKSNPISVPPPIPPKSLSLNERRDSVDSTTTPSSSNVQNGGKNENYSVPRLQNQRQ